MTTCKLEELEQDCKNYQLIITKQQILTCTRDNTTGESKYSEFNGDEQQGVNERSAHSRRKNQPVDLSVRAALLCIRRDADGNLQRTGLADSRIAA